MGRSALVGLLQPAAHAGLVVPIRVTEPPFQVRLLARDDAVANRDGQRQREDQDPRAARGYANAAVDEKQAEVDGIAAPAVNAGRDQRAGGLVRGYWCCRPGEVANTRGCERETDEDQGDGDCPVNRVVARKGEWQRQQAIRGEAEEERGEKEKRRSRYDARGCGVVRLLPGRFMPCLSRDLEITGQLLSHDNQGVILAS